MTYSKKQMMPLIEKYGINPESNQLFINICEMFDGQPNYQLWGVKVVFSKAATWDNLLRIKEWLDANQSLVQKLDKKNIIPYSSKLNINQLLNEMEWLDKITLVKNIISMFNTDQRNMLEKFANLKTITSTNAGGNKQFCDLHKWFSKFVKLSSDRKKNFIHKNSAVHEINAFLTNLRSAIEASYAWNREDLLAFVANNTPDSKVIYDNGNNIVILQVASYNSSRTLCGGGRTSWCITTSDSQWNNYVVSAKSNQYFFFDFSKDEKDELAHIGFTVSPQAGITHAHSTTDKSLIGNGIQYKGKYTNIQRAFKMVNVGYANFMPKKALKNFKWDYNSLLEFAEKNKNEVAVAYSNNNRIILNMLTNQSLTKVASHTYNRLENYQVVNDAHSVYVLFDFNLDSAEDNATLIITFQKDQYKTSTLDKIIDGYGADITKDGYLPKIGIRTDDYLHRENISPDILLHKLIDEGDEASAIKLIEDNIDTIDINYQFNHRIPVYLAMQNKMFKLVDMLISNKNFKTTVDEDDFEEPLFTTLLYLYTSEALVQTKDDEKAFRCMIDAILRNQNFDLNDQDLNFDSAVNICCDFPKLDWLAEDLISRPIVNVNIVNEYDSSALTNAIRNPNKKALTALGKRPDLIVRDIDVATAKEFGVNLDDYIKPQPMSGLENIVRKEPKKTEFDFAALFEKALAHCS